MESYLQSVYYQLVYAEGGNSMYDLNGYRIHAFTSSGTLRVVNGGPAQVLVVGGGGGGGHRAGGGGGAGGVVFKSITLEAGTDVTVIVGTGGSGGNTNSGGAGKGGDSSFGPVVATGGGGGMNPLGVLELRWTGGDGGSGGELRLLSWRGLHVRGRCADVAQLSLMRYGLHKPPCLISAGYS